MTTVLLIDDHELIRQGLARAFGAARDFNVVGEAGSVEEALALARRTQPASWSPTSAFPTAPASTSSAKLREDERASSASSCSPCTPATSSSSAPSRPAPRRSSPRTPRLTTLSRRPARRGLPARVHLRRPGRGHAAPHALTAPRSCPPASTRCSTCWPRAWVSPAIAAQLFVTESTAKTPHLEDLREARRRQPGAGDDERHPGRAHQVGYIATSGLISDTQV